ncbi:penicillin-binding protein [Candidatus Shapirobacteria bacterium CG_4_10_14_0_2_um_filter_40_12]|uniref:Penicillin-binding protein n=1 Tax=Candidatus Shapirobacteria bacterium CG_4_10_14_0_2_um_filter_40_12 TaxID=1974871 RepID=A0A2M7TUA2_9BACT|nr:MAG: penicillin-binding protein [Candidatus Shapirobacteria bacterium CG_4_10_14_0_2_um_filter_40_12]
MTKIYLSCFWHRLIKKISWYHFFWLLLIATGVMLLGILGLFVWFSKDLPSPLKVVRREGFTSRIYDRNGELIYDVYKDAKRTPVSWVDIPEFLKKATIAVEDKEFYKHQGFDPLTPLRIIKNIFYFHKLTGGSTLTQQLVKNVLLTSEVSITRKIKEFILAVQIEAKYKKDEILLMYLNEAPYGGSAWGVGAGSEQYFNKKVADLTFAESVILSGLPQRPNVYSPFSRTPTAYIARSEHVLTRMMEDGYITPDQKKETMLEVSNYKFFENKNQLLAPHFIFWIKDELSAKYGEDAVEGGGLKITTTLDLKIQKETQKIVSEEVDKGEKLGFTNGAAMVIDPSNGQVLAMVGSRDYSSTKTDGKFNVVTQALRQPGSAIKPVTYLTAIKKGYTAASLILDTPVTFPGVGGQPDYSPQNYTGKFLGPLSLRQALGNSINTTAVKMLARVGLPNMMKQAYEMGLSTLEPTAENLRRYGLSVTLGGADVRMIDMGMAYCAFANGGRKVEPVGVLKVEDAKGQTLEEYRPVPGMAVMTPQEAFIISNILSDNSAREITFGAVNNLSIPNYSVAVKTGTTNDKRDNWTIGWTPNLLSVVWVGNNNNSPMSKVASGVSGASPIWRRIMLSILPQRNKQDFPIPDKMANLEVDRVSGYAAHDGYPSRPEYFIDGTQPNGPDPIHLKLKICKDRAGLSPPEDVANGSFDEKEYFRFIEDDPVSTDGKNRWQDGINNWISQQSDKDKYNPPADFCRGGGQVVVNFDNPGDHSTQGNEFDVKVSTSSLKKITEVKLWVNGAENKVWMERPYETKLNLVDGLYTLKVKATDKDGNSAEREIKIGVNKPWDWTPSPTPTQTPIPTPTSLPTITPVIISPTATPSAIPT